MWRRAAHVEPPLDRDEVILIMGALADLKAWTLEILAIIKEDDEEEDDA